MQTLLLFHCCLAACSDIKAFAKKSYGVSFPLMGKVDVNGGSAEPLFKW